MLIQKLQQDNEELNSLIKQREDELANYENIVKDLAEKHRKEMLKEQTKIKKSVREKEKEIQKLKVELISVKKENIVQVKSEEQKKSD